MKISLIHASVWLQNEVQYHSSLKLLKLGENICIVTVIKSQFSDKLDRSSQKMWQVFYSFIYYKK